MKKITNEQGQTIEISEKKYNELFPKTNKNWRAQEGQTYWYIDDESRIDWSNEYRDKSDNHYYNTLNYFQTKEEAEAHGYRLLAIGKVTRAINELNGDWEPSWKDNSQDKYYIYYNHYTKRLDYSYLTVPQHPSNIPYIASAEITEQIIEEYKEELELILGIN